VRPTQPVEIFGNVSSTFGIVVSCPSADIYGRFYEDRHRGTLPSGGLNARGVANYSDFGDFGRHILETVQDR